MLPGNVLCLTFTNKATENLRLRVRRALAALELAEGEEPEVMNYHGFAAPSWTATACSRDRAGASGCLTQRSAASCARGCSTDDVRARLGRVAAVARVEDPGARRPGARTTGVTPEQIIAFIAARLEQLQEHRSDRAYQAAQERIELAEAVRDLPELKRDLGVIDFGDQIDRWRSRSSSGTPRSSADHRARFGPCCSTSTRTRTWPRRS